MTDAPASVGPSTGPQVYARTGIGARDTRARGTGRLLAGGLDTLWRTLLPSACALCGVVQAEVVCSACTDAHLPEIPRCPRCASPGHASPCAACIATPGPIDAARTLGDYATPQDSLVLTLKFCAALPVAGWFAERLAGRMGTRQGADRGPMAGASMPDLLVPVPLSARRLAERGFNQAWEIARPLARRLGIRADPTLLARQRDTVTQRALDLAARQENLRDAFVLAVPARLDGLHIGLVDDVMTTGATLREAARVLKAHGAARVTVLPALRTP